MMLSFSITSFAQQGSNRFDEESSRNVDESLQQNAESYVDEPPSNAGNPADPAPIDDYIPVFVITALGIIIYTTQKKKKLLS